MSVETTDHQVAGVPIRDIQLQALEVLRSLVEFCDAHAIRYYLVGGTLLGAVRHRGFIPWDDDIDIVVPRPDYQRLLSILGQLPASLQAIHPSRCRSTPYPFLVIRRTNSQLLVDYVRPFDRGIGVDVFPLDSVPTGAGARRLLFRSIRLMRALSMNKQKGYYRRPLDYGQRLRFRLLSFAAFFLSARFIYRIYDAFLVRGQVERCSLMGNLYGLYGEREVVAREVFGCGAQLSFEGSLFRVPEQPELYLQAIYGDFWQLPPADARHSGHRIRAVRVAVG